MKSCIYWFSGTGNSLWAAKVLAQYLGAAIEPMALYPDGAPADDSDVIGLVFPVYNHLIPYLVQRFVDRYPSFAGKTVFAVCTYGDSPGSSLTYLQKRITARGGGLAGGFAVKAPYNYVSPSKSFHSVFQPFRLRETSRAEQDELFTEAYVKLLAVAEYVIAGRAGALDAEHQGIERLIDRLHLRNTLQKRFWLRKAGVRGETRRTLVESVQLMDAGFSATSACIGCQTCVQVCPVQNVRFDGQRPVWQRRCEQCFACLQWCPAQAIQFGEGTKNGLRYHHPLIRLHELVLRPAGKERS